MWSAYVVRHGQTDWNIQHRIIGQSDPALAEVGLTQARKIAVKLESVDFNVVFTSPLLRARLTANVIAQPKGVSVVSEAALLEASFGDLEGRLIGNADVQSIWHQRSKDKYRFLPPGGESYRTLEKRLKPFIADLKDGIVAVMVTHVGVIRVMAHLYGNLSPAAAGEMQPG